VGLEAQACGCPVVGSGVSGIRSVVRDGVTGLLVEGSDPRDYADHIGRLLDDPQLARELGMRGQLLAQRFSWSRTADRLADLFSFLVLGHERAQLHVERGQDRVQAGMRHE
jgi:D-inositol-3-phosphate glycosyltransferase